MNQLNIFTLKAFRKLYAKIYDIKPKAKPICELDPDKVSQLIYNKLIENNPCMIARFGSGELFCVCNYLGVKEKKKKYFSYIKGNELDWWWNSKVIQNLHINAGFFPPEVKKLEQFSQMMINDMREVDILGSWLSEEDLFKNELVNAQKVRFTFLEPFFSKEPWTKALEGKKVLVIHPFTETIKKQYKNRKFIFKNDLLPEFELITIKAVQSIAGQKTPFNDWFDALEFMKIQIDETDYDIALIGCGAYGFPLAAHVKRMGKKAVHLGGSLQLLFGIKGKRWESHDKFNYSDLMNEFWVKPNSSETPQGAVKIENGCYW